MIALLKMRTNERRRKRRGNCGTECIDRKRCEAWEGSCLIIAQDKHLILLLWLTLTINFEKNLVSIIQVSDQYSSFIMIIPIIINENNDSIGGDEPSLN